MRRAAPAGGVPWAVIALGWLVCAPRCAAQDFASPALAWPGGSPLAVLERGLPPAEGGASLAGSSTRWFGIPELTTRAVGLAGSWRGARGAAGLSQTGDPELGWTALGLALGGAGKSGGGALRAVARRDRHPRPEDGALGPGVGLEAGAGAWAETGGGITLWASAPQIWLRGAAPPLARGLEIGGAFRAGGTGGWLLRRVTPGDDGADPAHEAGLALDLGPFSAWARAADGPLRGGIGLAARSRVAEAAVEVSSHPVLGETVSLAVAVPARSGPAPQVPRRVPGRGPRGAP